jgi:uncharacterized membrane protein
MAASDMKYYVFGGTYAGKADALKGLDAVKELHKAGKVKSFEAAAFDKDPKSGKVKVVKWHNPREAKATGIGVLVGAVLGLLFPAAFLGVIGGGLIGAAVGAVAGEVTKDFGRAYLKSIGDKLDAGRFGVVVVAHAMPSVSAAAMLPGAADAVKKETTGRRVAAELKKREKAAAKAAKPAPAKAAAKPAAKPAAAKKAPARKPAAKAAVAKKAAPAKAAAKPAAKKAPARKPAARKPAAKK